MASIQKEFFAIPKRYNTWAIGLMAVGLLSVIILFITHGSHTGEDEHSQHEAARFWASLLSNSVYFLLVVNAAMFFITATTLAWGGWQISFRRVSEAISTCVPVIGVITFIILMVLVYGPNHTLYHWASPHASEDPALEFKSGFLNKTFFTVWTIITIVGWWLLGRKMRHLSRSLDDRKPTVEEGKKYIWNNTVWAAVFIILFALTVLSSIPWLWLMSIDASPVIWNQ